MSEAVVADLETLDEELPLPGCEFCGLPFDPDAPEEERRCPARDGEEVCRP